MPREQVHLRNTRSTKHTKKVKADAQPKSLLTCHDCIAPQNNYPQLHVPAAALILVNVRFLADALGSLTRITPEAARLSERGAGSLAILTRMPLILSSIFVSILKGRD